MGEERQIRQVRSARQMPVRVQRLDDEILDVAVDKRAVGWVLFDIVCEQLNIIEKDYFGLNFINPEGVKYWLDNEKKIAKQMKGIVSLHLCFEVKFYPIDPLQMVEDITRYQLCLQIRRDIVNERVPCSTVTYALLGSFTAQSELGDFEVEDFGSGTSYLKEIQFAPKQDRDLLAQIAKLHKQHKGMTPEEAEIKFLENAEKLQFYGVEQHPAKDADGKDISLGVCAAGIIVYKDRQQVNRFVWPKILKMSYKRNKFYIKIRPGEFENFASLIGFRTVSVKMAKRLWKICVEHHSFFRFKEPESVKKYSVIPRFGSRFRYSGRTQYQSRQYVTAEDRDMPSFDRVLSKRGTFGGRTQNMRKRDEDRKRQRDQMRREPPPPPVQQDFGPPQTKLPKEYHEEPNGTRQEPKRTPPEPKHAPPVAPKPKPQIAPKPKPASRGPPSIDSASLDRGSRGSLNDSFEDVPDRRSRMEKMNAVMTPLAAVMQKSLQQNKHPEDEEVDGSHHEDDQRHHTDDEFEVGMRADKARNSFRLTNTDDGCRKTDKYLFSYPSSSIDSILSNDFEEYDTESNSCRNGLKNVASEEFLNKPETFDRNKLEQGQGSFKGQSYSAENLLSEETLSHYSMIDPRTSEGIYAEIEDLKTSIPTRNSNKLTQKSNTNRPDSIHGRRSKQFIPNQSSSTTMSLEHHQTQDASIASCTNQENNSSKRGRGKQNNDTLKLINSQVPGYAIVSKNRKDIPVSAKNPNSSINFDYDKSCDVILKTPIEPFYDTIENAKEPSHQRQDSQTSLKEELKMYIITPEKLKHNSETVYENSQFDNGESDQKHIKALYMNVTEKQCADENNIYQNPVDESIESGKLEQAEKRNREEKTEVNDCDESVLDQRNIPLNNKGEGCESSAIEMNHIPVLDDRKQIYQLTYDTSALNSPEGPKDSLSELELLPYSNSFSLNATEQEYINISNISSNSLDIGLAHSDPCKVNDETLDKSLELFCSLSTDSSDFDEPDTVKFGEKNNKKLEVRKNETLNISSTEKNSNLVKFQSSREEQTKGSKYEISETDSRKDVEKADKPKSVLGKVSSLVRKVPGFGPKVSKIKEKFKCEDFEKEPVRRMKPLQESSKCKLMAEDDNTSKIRNLKSSKIENKIELKEQHEFSNDKKSSDLITTPRNEKDKKSKYKVSKYDEGSTMDFFTKPETLEEFEEKAVCESDVLNASTNSNSSERVKMLDVNPFDNITDIQEIKYDFEKEELACPLDIEQKEIKSGTNVLPSDKSNVLLNKKEDKTTSLVSTNDDIDKDLKERKNPNPYWYKTHLLASKGSEEHENIKDTHQLPNIPQKDRKSSSISFSNTPPESIDLFSNKKLKAPYKTKETKPKVKRRDHKSESPKKTDSKSFPSTKNCYLSSPPEVRGSKVFVRDQALNNEPAKGMGQSCSHDKIKLPLIPATNLMHNKPLYKLDYSSDSSSSFSSINTHNNKDTRAHVKNGKQKSKKSRTSTSMETEFSNDSRNVSKSNNVVTDRRKIYPGVLHMVRPGPTGWIEGGVKSSVKRNETKLENKTSNTAPTSNLNTAPNIPDSLGDFAEKEICSSREITNGKVGEVMADRIDSTDHDHNEFESKSNDVGISLQNNAVSPVSELLCKRVWKYSKHKQENKDKENEGHDEDESDDYFTRAIEQGPDYKDNFGTSSSFGSSEAADNNQTGGSLPSKDETNTKYREQNLSSSADVVLSQIENQGKDDFEKNQDYHQNEINCDDSPLLEFGEEMAEHSKALSIENKTLQLSAKDNQGQDCVFEIDEFILPTSKENKDSRQRFQKKTSIKRKVCDEMIAETGSEGTTSTSDSSSENSYDISDEDSSAEEIVSFEMPKPRQTEGIIESTDVDIPFADEVGDVANDSPSSDLSGIAIDCSFEDVTSYQVNKGQSKNLATASDMYSNNFSQDDANYWDEDIEFSDYDDPMGEVEDPHIIPEVIDHTPFTTGKSNLKNSVRKETWFFDRRVHFQENLPVYKSRKNIGFHDDKPTDETLMNRAYDEGNKIDHLEKFIVGLFDEEPRNLSIPKLTPNTSSLPSPTSPYNLSKNFKDKSHNENNIFGYHSSITSENVNFSLDTLQTFAINEMNIGRDDRGDVITTDLDTIDYNDNQFEATFGTNSDFVKSNVPIKTEKRPPPKILKPVTGKKTKYSNADVGDTNFSQYNKTPDLFNFRSQNDAQNKIDQHYTASSHLNYGQRPSYRSQCSAELINGTWSYERPCSQSYPLPDLTDTNSGVSSTVYTRNQGREHLCDEPPNVCYNVEQTDKPITNQYVDVSQLSKNDQMTETNSDDDKITSESKKDQLEQSSSSNKDERDSRPMTPEVIEQEVRVEPVQQVQAPLSAKEKKQLEKEQKEKLKKEKEMEKMRKKEEEKEKKRLEKERKALILAEKKAAKQKSKQKGQERHAPERRDSKSSKSSMDMKGDWEEAQSQEHPGSVTPDRTVKRFSSFEERKEKGVDVVDDDYDDDDDDDDEPPPPPEPLDGSLKGRQKGRRGIKKEVESASQASDYGTDEENLKEHRREQRRHGDGFDENGEVSF